MHGDIFQVSGQPIRESLHDWQVILGDLDYAADRDAEERETAIKNLIGRFPDGMFEKTRDDYVVTYRLDNGNLKYKRYDNVVLRYNGGMDEWKKGYVKKIRELVGMLTEGNCMESLSPAYHLEKLLRNPLGEGVKFTFDDADSEMSLVDSRELMSFIDTFKPGDFLYIGGVLDYHV